MVEIRYVECQDCHGGFGPINAGYGSRRCRRCGGAGVLEMIVPEGYNGQV